MAAMAKRATNPQQIEAIQKSLIAGVQSGAIQPYVGIPLIQELTQKLTTAKAQMAQIVAGAGMQQPQQGQQAPQQPIAQQVMAQAGRGVETLSSNLPESYAGGGIIAFEDGGKVERYQNTGFTGMGNVGTPYSATNPNVAMNEFLKRLNLSPAQFANASPEAQKNILDMFKSVSEAPKSMATPTVTPTASAAPATSGPYRAGQATGQLLRGGASGTGNLLSRGLIGTIGGPATGGLAALLTPSPLGDDQAVLAAMRGEGYRGQPYDLVSARKILEAAGMDPNKAPAQPVTPVATPYDPATATRRYMFDGQEKPPASAAPANIGFKSPTLETYTPTIATMPVRTDPVLTDLNAITKDFPTKQKTIIDTAVTDAQSKLEAMDKPGFDTREGQLGKREAGQEKNSAITRALGIISTGLGVAGSKERSLAGALGKEGREGIRDLIQGEAASNAAKERLADARDNFEQQKVQAKKGNYQASQTAGREAGRDLLAATQFAYTSAQTGNAQGINMFNALSQSDVNKATVLNQAQQLNMNAVNQKNQNTVALAQLNQAAASTNAQLQLGRERLGILKDQIAAGNERARATLIQAENKASSTWQTSPQFQQAKAQASKMPPIEAQRFMQNSWLQYKENMLPSLMGGGGANIPSFSEMYKATE
jgi:hypothetical protein